MTICQHVHNFKRHFCSLEGLCQRDTPSFRHSNIPSSCCVHRLGSRECRGADAALARGQWLQREKAASLADRRQLSITGRATVSWNARLCLGMTLSALEPWHV